MSDSDTYAIVESGGKQYRAQKGGTLVVDRLPADEGAKVSLRAVMFRDDNSVVVAGGDLEKVKVEAVVAAHERGRKLRVFKYRPKKGYRRRAGHRSELTRLEVTEVRKLSKEAASEKAAARKPAAEKGTAKEAEAKEPAAEKGAAKEPAAEKAAPKRSTSKSGTAAKKPAASKSEGS